MPFFIHQPDPEGVLPQLLLCTLLLSRAGSTAALHGFSFVLGIPIRSPACSGMRGNYFSMFVPKGLSWRFLFYPSCIFTRTYNSLMCILRIYTNRCMPRARGCTGVFSALLLRFDAMRANADPADGEHGKFPKVRTAPPRHHRQQQAKVSPPPDVGEAIYVSLWSTAVAGLGFRGGGKGRGGRHAALKRYRLGATCGCVCVCFNTMTMTSRGNPSTPCSCMPQLCGGMRLLC